MIPRKALLVLVLGIPVLLVVFTVVMTFQMILAATGDTAGAAVAKSVGLGSLILLIVDLILLTWGVGIQNLGSVSSRSGPPASQSPGADSDAAWRDELEARFEAETDGQSEE